MNRGWMAKIPFCADGKSQVTVRYEDWGNRLLSKKWWWQCRIIPQNQWWRKEVVYNQIVTPFIKGIRFAFDRSKTAILWMAPVFGQSGGRYLTPGKIIVDTYGGISGGGAKRSFKVDLRCIRSVMLPKSGSCRRCGSGGNSGCPVMVTQIRFRWWWSVSCFHKGAESRIVEIVETYLTCARAASWKHWNCKASGYRPTAAYGHFGTSESRFTWGIRG